MISFVCQVRSGWCVFLITGRLFLPPPLVAEDRKTTAYLQDLVQAEAKSAHKECAAAIPFWEKVVESNPVEGKFWQQLATARYQAKDYQKAIPAFVRALELRAGFPSNSAYNVGCCYALLGERKPALEWLERAFAMGYRD